MAIRPIRSPHHKAAQVWDERLGSARIQARNWRLAALTMIALAIVLTALLAVMVSRSGVVPYVVEVDRLGEIRAAGPASDIYHPSDAQIAHFLARFVENVRSLSIDPVVVRANWLRAYDYVTDRGAQTLNACLSGCHPQPLAVVFGHAHGRSPAWQSSVPTIAPRVPATFFRRRGLRRLPGEGSLERRVCLPPLSGGGRAVPLRKSSWRLALPQVPP